MLSPWHKKKEKTEQQVLYCSAQSLPKESSYWHKSFLLTLQEIQGSFFTFLLDHWSIRTNICETIHVDLHAISAYSMHNITFGAWPALKSCKAWALLM
jgi:hypothetical protein